MKAFARSFLFAAIFCFVATSLCLAQLSTPKPAAPAASNVKTFDDLRTLLCAQPWSWELVGGKRQTIIFAPNGNVTNNSWVSRYMIIDLHKVTIHNKNGKSARVTFSDDYSSFSGLDFNETTPVSGKPQLDATQHAPGQMDNRPPQAIKPDAPTASSVKSLDDFRAILCAQPWSWELEGRKAQTITFEADGNVTNNSWTSRYTMIDLHKVTFNHANGRSAHITFAEDYSGFSGIDYDRTTPVSGKPKKP
jgi:hypothetical protein